MTPVIYAEPASADEPVVKVRGTQLILVLLGAVLGSWVITILAVDLIADLIWATIPAVELIAELVWAAIRAALFVVGVPL